MKKILLFSHLFLTLLAMPAAAQPLSVYTCLDSAEANMPLLKQQQLMQQVLVNKLKTYNHAYLPSVSINGRASYQSNVPELPFAIPGMPGLDIPKFQYRGYLELNQPLFDAGMSRAAKIAETAKHETKIQGLLVGLNEYKKQVAQLYFQMLLVGDQQEIITRSVELMREREAILKLALENGVAQQNDLLKLQSEILTLEQKLEELESAKINGMEILGILTGLKTKNRQLTEPTVDPVMNPTLLNNPELKLISVQKEGVMATEKMLKSQRLPRINLFGLAGYGSPNPLNFFNKDLSGYYMAGVQAKWNIWDWGKTSRERKNLKLTANMLTEQQNQKQLELESNVARLRNEQDRLSKALLRDERLLKMRSQIRKNAEVQVAEGVITNTDYLSEVLAEQLADLNRSANEIGLYQNRFMLQFETGAIK